MSAVTFQGLVSGIDTKSLIDGLVAAEKSTADTYTTQQGNLDKQNQIVGNLSTSMAALGSLAATMKLGSTTLSPQTATSSDAHVTVAASASAVSTTHDIRVKQTAQSQITSSRTFASSAAGVLGDGSVTIGSATIAYTSADSLDQIASKINDAKAGVSASVLNDGSTYRLVVTSTATGTAGVVPMTDTGDSLGLSDPANVKIPARDAIVSVDGVDVTRSKNVIDDAIPGLTITAVSPHTATDADAQVTVALDQTGVQTQLTGLVNAYNVIAAGLNGQLSYTGDGSTQKGADTLFGDSTLRQLQTRLGSLMTTTYGGHTLADLGLQRDKDGILSLDTSKLSTALASDPTIAASVITKGGFADQLSTMADEYDRAGDGILANKSTSLTSQSKIFQDEIDQINTRADGMRTQLQDQFNALETSLSSLKSQGDYLIQALGGTTTSTTSTTA